jgi:esterase/lipase superfamily enzyme
MFRWPSGGGLADYAADENVLELSTDAITGFVQQLNACALGAGAALHIVGHSMGNRALLKALTLVAQAVPAGQRVSIDKLVLAAPDVDARIFTRTRDKIRHQTGPGGLGGRKTLYLSRKDKALWLSETAHQDPRAGLAPPITLVDGVDTIDATDVDKTFLGHS